jgi:plastocyanin
MQMSTRSMLVPLAMAAMLACGSGDDGGIGPPPGGATLGSIVPSPTAITLSAGQRTEITMTALNTNSQPIANVSGYTYSSSAPAVAAVSNSGDVTGLSAGTATVTVSLTRGSVTKTVDVPVTVTGTLPLTATVVASGTSDTFTPNFVAIARTGTVTWTFGARAHNVNFQGTASAPANISDSVNESEARTFNTAGTFSYICTLHASMSGMVLVQ